MKLLFPILSLVFIFTSISAQAEDLRSLMREPKKAIFTPTAVSVGKRTIRSEVIEAELDRRALGEVSNTTLKVQFDDWVTASEGAKFLPITVRFDLRDGNFSRRLACKMYYEGNQTPDRRVLVACDSPRLTPFFLSDKELFGE